MINISNFDRPLTAYVQKWLEWFRPLMNLASFIGEPIITISAAIVSALVAYRQHQSHIVWAFAVALVAFATSTALKLFLHRTRPDTLYVTTMRFKSYSFPSGHAFGSTIIYGLLLYLAFSHSVAPWSYLMLACGGVLILGIGVSRIYLGAHFPSDVVGGWLLSLLLLILIIGLVVNRG